MNPHSAQNVSWCQTDNCYVANKWETEEPVPRITLFPVTATRAGETKPRQEVSLPAVSSTYIDFIWKTKRQVTVSLHDKSDLVYRYSN